MVVLESQSHLLSLLLSDGFLFGGNPYFAVSRMKGLGALISAAERLVPASRLSISNALNLFLLKFNCRTVVHSLPFST